MLWRGEQVFGKRGHKMSFTYAVLLLIGHMVGSGVLFISFFGVGWLVSYLVHWLDGIHKLATEIMIFVSKAELGFMYFDAVLCAIVLTAGAFRFIKDMGELR